MTDFVVTVFVGSFYGAVLSLLTALLGWVFRRQQLNHVLEMRRIKLAHELEYKKMQKEYIKSCEDKEKLQYLAQSPVKREESPRRHPANNENVSRWVENVRALVRPFLVVFYTLSLGGLFWVLTANINLGEMLGKEAITSYVGQIVEAVVGGSSTFATWWLGSYFITKRISEAEAEAEGEE